METNKNETQPVADSNADASARKSKRAGTLAFWSTFVGIAVLFISDVNAGDDSEPSPLTVVFIALSALIWISGLVSGFYALRLGRAHAQKRKWSRVHASIAANTLLLVLTAIGTFAFVRLMSEIHQSRKRSGEAEVQELRSTLPDDDAVQLELAKRAVRPFMMDAQKRQKRYESACRMLTDPPIIDFSAVTNRATLDDRMGVLREVIQESRDLRSSARDIIARFERELSKHPLSDETRATLIREFKQKTEPVNSLVLELRDADLQRLQSMLKLVQFMSRTWGKWTPDTNGLLQFNEDNLAAEYTRRVDEIHQLFERSKQLQADVKNH